jgi:hypothetical protein
MGEIGKAKEHLGKAIKLDGTFKLLDLMIALWSRCGRNGKYENTFSVFYNTSSFVICIMRTESMPPLLRDKKYLIYYGDS